MKKVYILWRNHGSPSEDEVVAIYLDYVKAKRDQDRLTLNERINYISYHVTSGHDLIEKI